MFIIFLAALASAATLVTEPEVGAVTTDAATVIVRVDQGADIAVEYADNASLTSSTTTSETTAVSGDDFAVAIGLTSLSSGTTYYEVQIDGTGTGDVLQFDTAPTGDTMKACVFADVRSGFNAAAYSNAAADGCTIALLIGDFDHGNPGTLATARDMHDEMRDVSDTHGTRLVNNITDEMAVAYVWDDHSYCGQDEDKNCANRTNALKAVKESWAFPTLPNGAEGIWHSFTWGDAEFFMLDTRSQRDDNADTDNGNKSMLDGDLIADDQLDWLKAGLSSSTATWKIVVSSVTMNNDARQNGDDHWGNSFTTECGEIGDYVTDNSIDGVVVVSGDLHSGGLHRQMCRLAGPMSA